MHTGVSAWPPTEAPQQQHTQVHDQPHARSPAVAQQRTTAAAAAAAPAVRDLSMLLQSDGLEDEEESGDDEGMCCVNGCEQ